MTALDLAFQFNKNEILEFLVKIGASMGKSKDMKKILFHAVKFNMLSLI